jgi:integrase/recombinase XerD
MVQTGLLAGCRVSELCNLQVEQVDLVAAAIALKGCKGDKDRNLPIAEKLLTALKEWIGERRTGNLFPGPKGRRLAPRTFQLRLATLARQAGILKRVHPHIMRHTFATSLLRTGADIAEVQQLLGHSSLKTTAAYLHVDVGRLKSAVDRL